MEISFTNNYIATDIFELQYEEELREDTETREDIIRTGLVVNMFLDDVLIGECFGITPIDYMWVMDKGQGLYNDEDAIEDVDMADDESVYVWSTTVLPQYRGFGYGKKLREEFARHASEECYSKLVGHATSPKMMRIVKNLGGIFHKKGVHKNWFDTERTAHFYTQFLTQTKDYNCGTFALAYLLELKGYPSASLEELEKNLKTNDEFGTSPSAIQAFLKKNKIAHRSMKTLEPDSIIDITVDGDGHWMTLISEYKGNLGLWHVYDPEEGYVTHTTEYLEENWVSPRYGKNKGFTLL